MWRESRVIVFHHDSEVRGKLTCAKHKKDINNFFFNCNFICNRYNYYSSHLLRLSYMLLVSYHERIQDFLSGGSRHDGQKTAWTLFFGFF